MCHGKYCVATCEVSACAVNVRFLTDAFYIAKRNPLVHARGSDSATRRHVISGGSVGRWGGEGGRAGGEKMFAHRQRENKSRSSIRALVERRLMQRRSITCGSEVTKLRFLPRRLLSSVPSRIRLANCSPSKLDFHGGGVDRAKMMEAMRNCRRDG